MAIDKRVGSAAAAVSDVRDGAVVMISGFGGAGFANDLVLALRDRFEEAARQGEMPVFVTSAQARPFARSVIERFRRETPVLSQAEIHSRARLKTVGSV